MKSLIQERFPTLLNVPHLGKWLFIQNQLGRKPNTIDAYARTLLDYISFCKDSSIEQATATREHVAAYIHNLANRPVQRGRFLVRTGYANATIRQRIVAVRLYYGYLQEEGLREDNPLESREYTLRKGFGGTRRIVLPHHERLPWIPSEEQWEAIITTARDEPVRNCLMLALAYDGGLRREELCALRIEDIDPSRRLVTIRAETTKTGHTRVVPYSVSTGLLYAAYLRQRRQLSRAADFLFLSNSKRNKGKPITIWTWSKVVHALAHRAGVAQFSTHSLRHLCLTDLARAGWELHEIATFAGHKNVDTTLKYIHLSGRELAQKFAKGMSAIHARRASTIQKLLS
jgi:integrase/recombinase XerD